MTSERPCALGSGALHTVTAQLSVSGGRGAPAGMPEALVSEVLEEFRTVARTGRGSEREARVSG